MAGYKEVLKVIRDDSSTEMTEEGRIEAVKRMQEEVAQADPALLVGHLVVLLIKKDAKDEYGCIRCIGGDSLAHEVMFGEVMEHYQTLGLIPSGKPDDEKVH